MVLSDLILKQRSMALSVWTGACGTAYVHQASLNLIQSIINNTLKYQPPQQHGYVGYVFLKQNMEAMPHGGKSVQTRGPTRGPTVAETSVFRPQLLHNGGGKARILISGLAHSAPRWRRGTTNARALR